jgi:methionyl aminopeptidase
MLILKTSKQLDKIKKSCNIASCILNTIRENIIPGITTIELNSIAEKLAKKYKTIPAFKGYHGFPYSICASVNSQVVHGFPTDKPLKEGDILSVDFGVIYEDWYSDTAFTKAVGRVSQKVENLLHVTEKALYSGIKNAQPFCRIGDISRAVQKEAEKFDYGVIRDLVGHGVGLDLHEFPQIPNYGIEGEGLILRPGTVIAIEPMFVEKSPQVKRLSDGWGIATKDGGYSTHFEHTVLITKEGPEILTLYKG